MLEEKTPDTGSEPINSGAQFLAAIAHELLKEEQEPAPDEMTYSQGGMEFNVPSGSGRPISTITGEQVPTVGEIAGKKAQVRGFLPGLAEQAAWFAPGSGNYLSAQEALKKSGEGSEALSQGKYGSAAMKYLESVPFALGVLPGVGMAIRDVSRLAEGAARLGKTAEEAGGAERLFTDAEKAAANATSRATGAVGAKAITPKYVAETAVPGEKILDFGAGKAAMHTKDLQRKGLDVTAYEFGKNVVPGVHDPTALSREYDTVYASNVLNVQNSPSMMNRTLEEIRGSVAPGGRAVVNYPTSPRKSDLSPAEVEKLLKSQFDEVKRVGGTKSAPLWEAKVSPDTLSVSNPDNSSTIDALADTPRWQILGLDGPKTPRDKMTAREELAELGGKKTPVTPMPDVGKQAQKMELLTLDQIRELNKKHANWFKQTLTTDEGKYFFNRIANNHGSSAIHVNQKTGLSLDLSTDCPERLSPCPYCYVEQGRKGEELLNMKGGAKKIIETPYRREILAMPQEVIDRLNANGGLRAHSFGDYRPVQDYNQWKLILADAEAKGLKVKAITKQPEFVHAFGDNPNLRINISVDYLPREMSNSPTMEEAVALAGGRPNIKIRTVALNEDQAWRQAADPRVDVVTMYHGLTGKKLEQIVEAQNPNLVKKIGRKRLREELDTWQAMSPHSNAFKRLAEKYPNKICCQSGKCGGDPTKCGFGMTAAGGLIVGVMLPEILNNKQEKNQ